MAGETHAVDLLSAAPAAAARIWAGLDKPWQEAFRQAWEALRTGNIAVGACASTPGGEIVCSARNRVNDGKGPPGEIFGSALAHAETNVLARLPFRSRRDLVLTTTLQPCLQCAGAIRLGPITTVRFAGPDRYWDGCHDFGRLSAREACRTQPGRIGPRRDELGTFATLISRFVHLPPAYEEALRALGEGPMVDLVHELEGGGEVERLAAMDVVRGVRIPVAPAPGTDEDPARLSAGTVLPRHRQHIWLIFLARGIWVTPDGLAPGPKPRTGRRRPPGVGGGASHGAPGRGAGRHGHRDPAGGFPRPHHQPEVRRAPRAGQDRTGAADGSGGRDAPRIGMGGSH